jgi:Sulfotransferase domain
MRLIGAGLPRTGTLSQKVALEMLGFAPCYHMVNVLGDLDLALAWRRALDGDANWDEIFGDNQATVDWPGSYFYRELLDVYPDAKVLLSVRDGDAWAASMRDTIWGHFYSDELFMHLSEARRKVDPKWDAYIDMCIEMWRRSGLIWSEELDLDWMSAAVDRYHADVQRNVPADRLLVWTAKDGWEPLCEFLEVPVPDQPFPHLNDSETYVQRVIDAALLKLQEWRKEQQEPVPAAR